jgi:hypothetical protein
MSGRRLAFLVLAHADPAQLARLIHALDWRADFFVHVDAKSDIRPFLERSWPASVRFLSDRVAVRWGGFSMVTATLRLLRACLATGEDHLRLVLLSGACFPIKPVRQLHDHLAADPAREQMRLADLASAPRDIVERVTRYWWFDRFDVVARSARPANLARIALRKTMHLASTPLRKPIAPAAAEGRRLAFGSQWWAVSTPGARRLVAAAAASPWLDALLATSLAPDEIYFHTLAASLPEFRGNLVPYHGKGVAELANLHHIEPSLTKTFTLADFDELARSDRFFVRKLGSDRSAPLVDRICAELL